MAHHPGQAITDCHVASLVNGAYQKAASVASAVNGFRASGIYPFDRDVFSEADFSGALTTEHAVETNPPTVSAATPVAANHETDEGVTVSTDQVSSSIVIPEQVRPYPAAQRSSAVKKRAVVRAQLLTASPYRQQLLDQQEAKRTGKRRAKPHESHQLKKKRLNLPATGTNTVDNTPCLFCEIPYSESDVPSSHSSSARTALLGFVKHVRVGLQSRKKYSLVLIVSRYIMFPRTAIMCC